MAANSPPRPPSLREGGGLTTRDAARLYAAYAPELRKRVGIAAVVLAGVAVAGVGCVAVAIFSGQPLLAAFGAVFLLVSLVLAFQARPMTRPRMLLLRGRVVEVEPSTSESGAEMSIVLARVMRIRPDGLMREIPSSAVQQKLGIADQVYTELAARRHSWPDLEFLAGNDYFVLATLATARGRSSN
jgi:hypothetical protein